LRVLTGTAFDVRLLALGESYCEDEARTVFEKMLTQVHIVGEGYDQQNHLVMLFVIYPDTAFVPTREVTCSICVARLI
jgi:hypothetical protein